ncbi:MAG: hypothetical protein AAGF12_40785 [Myxococcota bacterium]
MNGNREIGILLAGEGSQADVTDLIVEDTWPQSCAESACEGYGSGTGLAVVHGARLDADRFIIQRSTLVAAHVVEAEMSLRNGRLIESPIGLNLWSVPGETEDLTFNVTFEDIARHVASDVLPVPKLRAF